MCARVSTPLVVVLCLALGVLSAWGRAAAALDARNVVAAELGFSARDLARARNGTPVARLLPASDDREVAVAGLVVMRVAPERYLARLSRIEQFKRSDLVRQVGKVSRPPRPEDFAALQLERSEADALRRCRPGDCDLQLPLATIERLGALDWGSGDAHARAVSLVGTLLYDRATAYTRGTGPAPLVYRHGDAAVDVEQEFRDLARTDRLVLQHLPDLRERLVRGGMEDAGPTPDFLYWSREKVARKVVLSLTHVAFASPAAMPGVRVVATRQLYASHYFQSSLGLTLLLPVDGAPGSTLVVYVNRSRVDAFSGLFGGITRRLVRGRAAAALEDQLEQLRTRLQASG